MRTRLHNSDAASRLSHGRMVATLISKESGEHITLRLTCKNKRLTEERKTRSRNEPGRTRAKSSDNYITYDEAAIITMDVPQYRDPEGNYSQGGDRTAWVHPTKGIQANKGADPQRWWAAQRLWEYITTGHLHPQITLKLEDVCSRCSRPISHQDSIERHMGPECYGQKYLTKHQRRESRDHSLGRDEASQTTLPVGS